MKKLLEKKDIVSMILTYIKDYGKITKYHQTTVNEVNLQHCKKTITVSSYKNEKGLEFIIEDINITDYNDKFIGNDKIFYKKQKDGDLRKYMHFPDIVPDIPTFDSTENKLYKIWEEDIVYYIFKDHIQAKHTNNTSNEKLKYKLYIELDKYKMKEITDAIYTYTNEYRRL